MAAQTELEKKIIKQVEHYFGARNLMRDKFLSEKIKEDDGWVSMECLLTFNRLKALSEDPLVVLSALEKSTNNILEINKEEKKVRRSPEIKLPEKKDKAYWEDVQKKSAHVSGLPDTYRLSDVEQWLEGFGVESEYIKFVRTEEKKFVGEINIQFKDENDLESFIKATSESPIKIEENEIKIYKLTDYMQEKNVTHAKKLVEKKNSLKKKQSDRFVFCPGKIIRINEISMDARAETVRNALDPLSKVDWVHFDSATHQCYVRFQEGNIAESVIEALKGSKFEQLGENISFEAVTGDEEKTAWELLLPKNLETRNHNPRRIDKSKRSGKVSSGGIVKEAEAAHKYFKDEEHENKNCNGNESNLKSEDSVSNKRPCPEEFTKEDVDDSLTKTKSLRNE